MAVERLRAPGGVCRIAISGSYGGSNLGDEAILHAMVAQLRGAVPAEITVFTQNPADTLRRHGVERAVPIRDLTRDQAREEVGRHDLLILGGGGILYDGGSERYLREVTLAQETGTPVAVYAISAGPLTNPGTRELVRDKLKDVALLTVRDRQGRQLLEEVGVEREIHVTADPALLLEPEELPDDALRREGLQDVRRLVGFSVREPGPAAPDIDVSHYHALLANAADFMVDRFDADILFVPMERGHQDVQQSHAVVSQMRCAQRANVLKAEYRSGELLSLMRHLDFAVGMRLHFLILAALQGVPFVALPYASKVRGFVEEMDMRAPPLDQVTTGRLLSHIDRAWDNQGEIRARIASRLPGLQHRARETNRLVLELLKSRGLLLAEPEPRVSNG